MPVEAQYQQIALVPLRAFNNRLHFVPLNKFGRQDHAFPLSGLLRTGLQVSVIIDGLLT